MNLLGKSEEIIVLTSDDTVIFYSEPKIGFDLHHILLLHYRIIQKLHETLRSFVQL